MPCSAASDHLLCLRPFFYFHRFSDSNRVFHVSDLGKVDGREGFTVRWPTKLLTLGTTRARIKKHMPVRLIKHREYSGLPLRPTVSIKLPLACFRRFHVGWKFTDKIVYFCVSRATKKKNAWNQREGGIIFPTLAHFNCMHISRNELKVTDKRHVPERQ